MSIDSKSFGKRYVLTDKGKAYRFECLYDAEIFCDMYSKKGSCELISKIDEKQFLAVYEDILIGMYPINNYTGFCKVI